jgi:hypothetical protein
MDLSQTLLSKFIYLLSPLSFRLLYPMRGFRDGQMWPFDLGMPVVKQQSRLVPVEGFLRFTHRSVLRCLEQGLCQLLDVPLLAANPDGRVRAHWVRLAAPSGAAKAKQISNKESQTRHVCMCVYNFLDKIPVLPSQFRCNASVEKIQQKK